MGSREIFRLVRASALQRRFELSARAAQVPVGLRGVPIVTPRFIAAAHAAGLEVHVWTIDDPAEMRRLLSLGVDGIMTDRPDLLRDVLRERGEWP
jgi:glycerophosphoryl diester phosphodiesterase